MESTFKSGQLVRVNLAWHASRKRNVSRRCHGRSAGNFGERANRLSSLRAAD